MLYPDAADACERLVRDRFDGQGALLSPHRLRPETPFSVSHRKPFTKRLMCYVAPNGDRHRIEFLGAGPASDILWLSRRRETRLSVAGRSRPPEGAAARMACHYRGEVDELLTDIDDLLVEQFDFSRAGTGKERRATSRRSTYRTSRAPSPKIDYTGIGGGGNLHDTELGCINALSSRSSTEAAIEESAGRASVLCRH